MVAKAKKVKLTPSEIGAQIYSLEMRLHRPHGIGVTHASVKQPEQ